MLVVTMPLTPYGHPMPPEVQLRCAFCRKRFRTLSQAFLCYAVPAVGAKVEARCGHRKCAEAAEVPVRLWRLDFALRTLLEALIQPAIPVAALKDLRRHGPGNGAS